MVIVTHNFSGGKVHNARMELIFIKFIVGKIAYIFKLYIKRNAFYNRSNPNYLFYCMECCKKKIKRHMH